MNNIDGSYFAAVQFGHAREQRLQEQARLLADVERYKKDVRRSWIQFWVPLMVSILALFRPEITVFIEWIMGLFTQK